MTLPKKKICLVAASEMTFRAFLVEQIRALSARYELVLVASFGDVAFWQTLDPPPQCVTIRLERRISPVADAAAVLALYRLLRVGGFDAVHSVTPKAGLATAIAAFLARVPARIHTFTGQVWATRTGAARGVLKLLDRVIAALATHVLVDSRSQLEFLRGEGVLPPGKGAVLAGGSISGVDVARFHPDDRARAEVRHELGIPGEARLFLYLGRLNRDKGMLLLARAFEGVARERANAFLLLVGPDEEDMRPTLLDIAGAGAARMRFVPYSTAPERYLAAADILCLPSFREGFGTVVIEAAASGVPAIASRIYGLADSVEEGVTGLLVPPADPAALREAMLRLSDDPRRVALMGSRARERALLHFDSGAVTAAVLDFYEATV